MKPIADSNAKREWDAKNTLLITIKLNYHTDSDIIKKLDRSKPLATQVKDLIRKSSE